MKYLGLLILILVLIFSGQPSYAWADTICYFKADYCANSGVVNNHQTLGSGALRSCTLEGTNFKWNISSYSGSECGIKPSDFFKNFTESSPCPSGWVHTSTSSTHYCSMSSKTDSSVFLTVHPSTGRNICAYTRTTDSYKFFFALGYQIYQEGIPTENNLPDGPWEIYEESDCQPYYPNGPDGGGGRNDGGGGGDDNQQCPPGGDCECSDIICRCIEALAAIVEQFKQAVIPLLEQIRDAVSSTQEFVSIDFDYVNQQLSNSFNSCNASYDHLDLQPRSFSEILGLLSNKMPFDVWGNTSIPSTDGCVNIEISGRSIRVCAFGFAGRVFGQIAGLVLILRAIVRG